MKLILASKSPRRREILGMVTKDFSVRVSEADESYRADTPLEDVPRLLAERKAMAINAEADEVIIGCDTVVIYDGELMGKPLDKADAIRMLKALSDTTHQVISGICVRTKEKSYSCAVTTYVKFKSLTNEEIEGYEGLEDLYERVVAAAKDESECCEPDDCEDIDYDDASYTVAIPDVIYNEVQEEE